MIDQKDLQLAYLATFGNGSLKSSVDRIGVGALKSGGSQVANSNPLWTPQTGRILLGITGPAAGGPVSAGLFATPVNFATGSIFGLRATFHAPIGSHEAGAQWAVSLGARTGGEDDLPAETRVAATFQIRADGARLNAVGAITPINLPNVHQDVYDAIFNPTDPEPFTLELLIDRVTGASNVTLKAGGFVIARNFQPAGFPPNAGPAITAVGPSIAITKGPGESASVQVSDFEIFLPK